MERLFGEGSLPVLCTTSTLAMGVNLPAHLVVVKSTQAWRGAGKGYTEYPSSQLLQMMVRLAQAHLFSHPLMRSLHSSNAGPRRTTAVRHFGDCRDHDARWDAGATPFLIAVPCFALLRCFTDRSNFPSTQGLYRSITSGASPVESTLGASLVEHVVSEVTLRTITSVNTGMDLLRSTFLNIRMRRCVSL